MAGISEERAIAGKRKGVPCDKAGETGQRGSQRVGGDWRTFLPGPMACSAA